MWSDSLSPLTPHMHSHAHTHTHTDTSIRGPFLAPYVPGPQGDIGETTAPSVMEVLVLYRSPHAVKMHLLVSPRS